MSSRARFRTGAAAAAPWNPELEDTALEDAAFEDTVLEDAAFEDTLFEDPAFEHAVPEDTASRNTRGAPART